MPATKKDIINRLRKDILLLEGFKPPAAEAVSVMGLGIVEKAFPNGIFPAGTVHEFLGITAEQGSSLRGLHDRRF